MNKLFTAFRFVAAALIFFFMITIGAASAALRAEEVQLTCAFAAFSAYSSETSELMRAQLMSRGWKSEEIKGFATKADARALLFRREGDDGFINVLAICGAEDRKDEEIDLRVKLVPFGGGAGLVHQGFNDYTDVLINSERVQTLIDDLTVTGEKLYITGNDLGGAVAILTAARLTDLGLGEQIEVITFGAPAVGERTFASHFNNVINLTRITIDGDPIKKSLRKMYYAHFGTELKYTPAKSVEHFRNKPAVYLDCALRNYYDTIDDDIEIVDDIDDNARIYVAPLRIVKDSFNRDDVKYVAPIIRDALRSKGVIFDPTPMIEINRKQYEDAFADNDDEILTAARAAGCDRVLIQLIQSAKMREVRGDINEVTLERIVCNLKGFPLSMQTSHMNTREMTALEAILFAQFQSPL